MRAGTRERRGWRAVAVSALLLAMLTGGAAARAQEDAEVGAVGLGGSTVQGTVTRVEGERLAIRTGMGETFHIALTTNSRILRDRQMIRASEIHPGDGVGAVGVLDAPAKTVHAAVLYVVDSEQAKKARANLGRTYIAGKVTRIVNLDLTILRPDGVKQTIAVDEGTSFRRGGRQLNAILTGNAAGGGDQEAAGEESITLGDIKVGDNVAGKGGLKKGIFVPTRLTVVHPQLTVVHGTGIRAENR